MKSTPPTPAAHSLLVSGNTISSVPARATTLPGTALTRGRSTISSQDVLARLELAKHMRAGASDYSQVRPSRLSRVVFKNPQKGLS